MVSSPWKGPQVSDGFTLSGQSSGVSRMLLSGGLLGSGRPSWPVPLAQGTVLALGAGLQPPRGQALPCSQQGGVLIPLPSTEEHLGTAGLGEGGTHQRLPGHMQ